MQIIDLFSGTGGFSLGAHLAGFSVPLAIDIDEDLTYSHKSNFPNTRMLLEDLSKIDPMSALKLINLKPGNLAGIIGGPPCQGFSYIGKRDPKDPRNNLVNHFFRFVQAARPKFFVMENVPGLLTPPFQVVLEDAINQVEKLYNIVGPLIVDAADYGAATTRRRAVVIGYRPSYVNPISEEDIEAAKRKRKTTVYEAIHDLPSLKSAAMDEQRQFWARYDSEPDDGELGKYARKARRAPKSDLATKAIREAHGRQLVSGFSPTRHTLEVLKRFSKVPPGTSDKISRCPRLAWHSTCSTIRAGTGTDRGSYQSLRPLHPEEDRVITAREAARIQGFPDWFQFHPTIWHSFRMIGNSVSPYLAACLLSLLAIRMGIQVVRQRRTHSAPRR